MLLHLDAPALRAFLDRSEDAEALGGGEYTLDLYDAEPPVSLDLQFEKGRVSVLAALALLYDEELEGWYLGEAIEDTELLKRLLEEAMRAGAYA